MNVGTITAVLALTDHLSGPLQSINAKMDGFASAARTAAGVAAGAFASIDWAKMANRAVESTSKIADTAAKMQIGAEAAQRFAFAAEQSGKNIDTVATAMREMAKSLSGDKKAEDLFDRLGISLEKIRTLKPEDQLLAMTDAVRGIADPTEKANAMLVLFGRSGVELLPAVQAGFREVAASAPVMAQATIEAGDRVGDAQNKLKLQIQKVQTEALVPLMEQFTKLPDSVQTGVGGILAFMPSLEAITLAVIALGGPAGAFAALKGAVVAVGTLLTGTLIPAFAAILPWLLPAGVIVGGIMAVIAAWQNWDRIKAIVQGVYTAVKEWLVDKFNAIVDGVREKVGAITGFFRDLYDKVVGNSYVPDLIRRIADEFARLQDVMVRPTRQATGDMVGDFVSLLGAVDQLLGTRFATAVRNFVEAWRNARRQNKETNDGMASDFSNTVTAMMAGIDLVMAAWGPLRQAFSGGEEGMYVNPARDAFIARFGPSGTGEGSGFQRLAALLTQHGAGEGGGALFALLRQADTMEKFNRAVDAILGFLRQNNVPGFAMGSGGLRDFGRGTLAVLHGREEVRTEAQVRGDTALLDEIAGLRSDLQAFTRTIPLSIRDAVLLAG